MSEEITFFKYMKEKKINIKDFVNLIHLFDITEFVTVGEDGVKSSIVDYFKCSGIKVKVLKRFDKNE